MSGLDAFADVIGQAMGPWGGTLMSLLEDGSGARANHYRNQYKGEMGDYQALAARIARKKFGWGAGQWPELNELVQRESSWNPQADNPTSTAYGLFQFLDSTRENYGIGLNAGPRKQIRAGLQYIRDRYGSPQAALRFHDQHGWY